MQNIDVVERKLREYIETFPRGYDWDGQCDQTLVESITAISKGDEFAEGFVAGILAMITRDNPHFHQWADEICMSILPHDECVVMVD